MPPGFVGVDAGGPLFSGQVAVSAQLDTMVASGVESIRVVFNWSQAQPYRSWGDVPPEQRGLYVDVGGVPTSFGGTDDIVRLAAEHGLTVLPVVLFAPGWDAGSNPRGFPPPADTAPYARYLTALIQRYGPRGSFWATNHPKLAIREWQIWNEPNLSGYWPQPFAASYVRLLRAAHDAVKRADPRAKVVLGALTNTAWKYVGQIARIRGAGKLFDIVAVNGFTSTPNRVLEFLQFVRRAVNRLGGARKPLLATELSFPSSRGVRLPQSDWDRTQRGQASAIRRLLPLLAANRTSLGLAGFYYYTWMTEEDLPTQDNFSFAGLVRYSRSGRVAPKPALSAFRGAALTIEQCRSKSRVATRCARRL